MDYAASQTMGNVALTLTLLNIVYTLVTVLAIAVTVAAVVSVDEAEGIYYQLILLEPSSTEYK